MKLKKSIKTAFRKTVGVALIGVSIFFGYKAVKELETEKHFTAVSNDVQKIATNEETNGKDVVRNDYMDRKIDFGALLSKNEDTYAWLTVPNTPIDYPVMKEPVPDQYFYLTHDFNKDYYIGGSLFIANVPEDMHTIIFGHKMFSNTDTIWSNTEAIAFSSLTRYQDQAYGTANPDLYMYYPDRTEHWTLWAMINGDAYDNVYNTPYMSESLEYQNLLTELKNKADYTLGDDPKTNDKITVLSTCKSVEEGNTERIQLVYKLVKNDHEANKN